MSLLQAVGLSRAWYLVFAEGWLKTRQYKTDRLKRKAESGKRKGELQRASQAMLATSGKERIGQQEI